MKVAMLTGSLSRLGGGVSEIVRSLSVALATDGVNVQALGTRDASTQEDLPAWGQVPTFPQRFWGPASLGFAPGLTRALHNANPDVLHLHGIWMYASLVAARWARQTGRPHIVTPQGMLEPWSMAHHHMQKRLIWSLYEGRHLHQATCINVNTTAELAHVRDLGLTNPVCIVPNGIELPVTSRHAVPPPWADVWNKGERILLFLGRLHPKKGLLELVDAWSKAKQTTANNQWRLAIIGWDQDGYASRLCARIEQLGLEGEIRWFGPVFGEMKSAAYLGAHAAILPSFSEGLPMSVLEAWSFGLPVMMSRECNLENGFAAGAAIEVSPAQPEVSIEGLRQLWNMSEEQRLVMGKAGYSLVSSDYTWRQVAAELKQVYVWMLGRAEKPDCVSLD